MKFRAGYTATLTAGIAFLLRGQPLQATVPAVPRESSEDSRGQRTIISLYIGTKRDVVVGEMGSKAVKLEGTRYYLDATVGAEGRRKRLWQEFVCRPEKSFWTRSNFVCFASEADNRVGVAFTEGPGVSFVEADLSKPLVPAETEAARAGAAQRTEAEAGPHSEGLGLWTWDGGRLWPKLLEAPPRVVGLGRKGEKWPVLVDVAGSLMIFSQDGDGKWVLVKEAEVP